MHRSDSTAVEYTGEKLWCRAGGLETQARACERRCVSISSACTLYLRNPQQKTGIPAATDEDPLLCSDNSLFASVMDYLAVEKGWFSPYLYASGRRPAIPRSVKPDVVFCHGPFLSGMSSLASLPCGKPECSARLLLRPLIFPSHTSNSVGPTQATTNSAKPYSRNPRW